MKQEINPKNTSRAYAFEMWMNSPMPMVTLLKTLDVTRLVRKSRKTGMKFNMLLCWCIGKAASGIDEFYSLPEKPRGSEQGAVMAGRLFRYDRLAVNVIVNNKAGGINSCDIPYADDLTQFNADYLSMTQSASTSCTDISLEDAMAIGTSALVTTELDGIVNQYSGIFNNPFLAWARYRRHWLRTTLTVSFQFHHVQMDGAQAARFLDRLQSTINKI